MKDLQFRVIDQELKLDNSRCGKNNSFIVKGSRNYLRLRFYFTGWDEFEKHAQFIDGNDHYDFLLDSDDCLKVPNDFVEDGVFKFLLVGYDVAADERVTTNTMQLRLLNTEYSDDISSYTDDTEDVYRYLVNCIDGKADASDLDNYVLNSKILSDISLATDNTQLVGAKELKDEMDELRGEVPTGVELTANKMTSWSDTPNNTHYASEKLTKDSLDLKVDKVDGKALSSNDFTNSYKSTLDDLKTVAVTGSYNDLSNKPSIPSSSSDLSDGSDLVKKSNTSGLIKNDGSIDTSTYLTEHQDISNYIQKSETSGLVKNDGGIDTNNYLTEHQSLSGYLKTTDVVDNLTSTSSTAPLSAKQGKVLAGLIGDAILYINGSG